MPAPAMFARPLPGVVGETRRVGHIFPIPSPDSIPERLDACCGASFEPGELEQLDYPRGMPCEICLGRYLAADAGVAQLADQESPIVIEAPNRENWVIEES